MQKDHGGSGGELKGSGAFFGRTGALALAAHGGLLLTVNRVAVAENVL